jgi:hypothetical protein
VREEREASADATAVGPATATADPGGRWAYADVLLSVAERCATHDDRPQIAGVGLAGPLERRVRRLLDTRPAADRRRLTLALGVVAAGSAVGLGIAQPAVSLGDDRSQWTLTDHLLGENPTIVVDRRVVVRHDVVRRVVRTPPPVRDGPRRTAR